MCVCVCVCVCMWGRGGRGEGDGVGRGDSLIQTVCVEGGGGTGKVIHLFQTALKNLGPLSIFILVSS